MRRKKNATIFRTISFGLCEKEKGVLQIPRIFPETPYSTKTAINYVSIMFTLDNHTLFIILFWFVSLCVVLNRISGLNQFWVTRRSDFLALIGFLVRLVLFRCSTHSTF